MIIWATDVMDISTAILYDLSNCEQQELHCKGIYVLLLQDGSTLAVQQFHFTTWPDHGVPLYPTSLLAFHRKFCSSYDSPSTPTVIHCSAGVGRTGTFIALDYLLDQAKAEGSVDVYGCVCRMRNNRVNMVQTVVCTANILIHFLIHVLLVSKIECCVHIFLRAYQTLLQLLLILSVAD